MKKKTTLTEEEFKKMLKEEKPSKIIEKHINWKITLSEKQLKEVIRKKNM